MTIREQIDQILANRKQKCEQLRSRKETFQRLRSILKDSGTLLTQASAIQDEKLRAQYVKTFSGLNTGALVRQSSQLIRCLDNAIARFGRDYISIATVGKERQGKSQFLQSVGHLKNEVIPAYDSTSCTGATSVIWNKADMPQNSVMAKITFRQPQELVDIVRPYIEELNPDYLSEHPLTFDDIWDVNVEELEQHILETGQTADAKKSTALKHLKLIMEHLDEIYPLFGAPSETETRPERIQTFVAQNNGIRVGDAGREEYYKYLAVSRADIYCPFFTDVGRLRLVDTVGIGDTKYGIEDMMLTTVDRECDAAIVVTCPISAIQESDQDLYTSLRNRFRTRDTGLWLFYLANHFVGRNDNTVDAFRNDILQSKWAVADCRIVDASNPEAVRDDFLLPMLETLLSNMDKIDEACLTEANTLEANLREAAGRFLASLPDLQDITTSSMLGKEAFEKGKRCFNRMTADLSQIVYRWSLEKDRPNSILWNSVQSILNSLDSIIPTPEKIDAISLQNGYLTGQNIWETTLHYVRNEITDRFIAIDRVLERETLEFKNSLVRTLYHELQSLSPREPAEGDEENFDMVGWLRNMIDSILSTNSQYEQIRKGFQFLFDFEFNTRAQIIQEVRRQLYIINPICAEYAAPVYNFTKMDCGEAVYFYLTSRMSVIEDELRYHLGELYRTPNQAFYAAAEEFYDRLTFASDLSGDELISMSDVWGSFFQEYSSRLWKDDVSRLEAVTKLLDAYNDMKKALGGILSGPQA